MVGWQRVARNVPLSSTVRTARRPLQTARRPRRQPLSRLGRGDPDQRGDLAVREPSQFGPLRRQGERAERTAARHPAQPVVLLAPPWTRAPPLAPVVVDLLPVALQPLQRRLETSASQRHPRCPQTVRFRTAPRHPLAPPLDERPCAGAAASGSGRAVGRTAWPQCPSTGAARRAVAASRPVARAQARPWRGWTTATGRLALPRSATSGAASPPVASRSR